jgi:23S rRNA (cytidine2498-2'-O)-methyltransferase
LKSLFESNFLFTTCQVGAEPTLKKELAREHPELKFAYSRPGFLTFKHPSETIRLDFELKSVFARAYGVSIGGLTQVADLKLPQDLNTKPRLHAWERDITPPGEEPLNFVYGPKAAEIETRFRTIHADAFESSTIPKKGDFVLDVILLEENQPHSFWLGAHLHSPSHSPWPGGRTPLTLPKEAPSRAYLKLEEGLLWSKAPVQRGDTAIEIGSAPGGASYALLKRGLKVVGIDPGQMAPLVSPASSV